MFIFIILLILFGYLVLNQNGIHDFAQIHVCNPYRICKPKTVKEIIKVIQDHPDKKISIAGSKYSHGGQTLSDNALYLDLADFNQILSCDKSTITVESGTTWKQIIEYADQYDLSVSEMQSYYNFSVGGSISVNCHGRGLLYGTLADSVENLVVLTTDLQILFANRQINFDLFQAIIGGYGGIAIILYATLKLTPNYIIEKKVIPIPRNSFSEFIKQLQDPNLVFYNGIIYPKKEDMIYNICWYKCQKPLTCTDRIQKYGKTHFKKMFLEQLVRRHDVFKEIRAELEPEMLKKPEVVYRNYELSYDAETLEPLFKFPTTTILQEYFIPVSQTTKFLDYFYLVIKFYEVNLLNLSLRYVKSTQIPILNYAPGDRMAVVLYLNLGNNRLSLNYAKRWTRLLIQLAINLGGSYYLPYLPFATKKQFQLAYPNYVRYKQIKLKYDPKNRLTNQFLEKYLS